MRWPLVVVSTAQLCAGVAGLITGSSALLAEATHSAADSINEVLLAVSLHRSRRPADAEHPYGYGGARFLWAFLAAISTFLIGGCLSIGLAVHSLLSGGEVDRFLVGWIVLDYRAQRARLRALDQSGISRRSGRSATDIR